MVIENRKQCVSVRMSVADLRKVKEIARRLDVRESDVFRFAIKNTLAKLTPLHDSDVKGSDLVPVFIECGTELAKYFDLDSMRLDSIINSGVSEPDKKVDRDDLELLAMTGMQEHYLVKKLKDLSHKRTDGPGIASLLREYLYEKYLNGRPEEAAN